MTLKRHGMEQFSFFFFKKKKKKRNFVDRRGWTRTDEGAGMWNQIGGRNEEKKEKNRARAKAARKSKSKGGMKEIEPQD